MTQKLKSLILAALMVFSVFSVASFAAVPAAANHAQSDVLTVDGVGNEASHYATINNAVENATSGDTVSVENGTYTEWVPVETKSITLKSEHEHGATVDGTITVRRSNVAVKGFEVTGGYEGITVEPNNGATSGVVIENNHLHDFPEAGGGGSKEAFGILAWATGSKELESLTIRGNTIENVGSDANDAQGFGIFVEDLSAPPKSGLVVEDNTVRNIKTATINGDRYPGVAVSVLPELTDPSASTSDTSIVTDNANARISGNTFSSNPVDVSVAGDVTNFDVQRNDFDGSGHGVISVGNSPQDGSIGVTELSGSTQSVISNGPVDADLNWWKDSEASGVSTKGSVTHDPFLTAQPSSVTTPVSDTQKYGHDLTVPHDGDLHTIAFPGPVDGTIQTEIIDHLGNGEEVYAYDPSTDSFTSYSPSDPVESHDAYIISTNASLSGDITFVVDFEDSSTVAAPDSDSLSEGWNFVAGPQYGSVSSVYNLGSNELSQVQHVYAQPGSQPYNAGASMFAVGPSSGKRLSAFGGYWVYVNSDTSVPVAVPRGVTAGSESGYIEP